ncbi:MAG: MFS transporter, partial [Rhodospirillales bacterium]|nr:MFS transporter [Rhodospirillales bacterium]
MTEAAAGERTNWGMVFLAVAAGMMAAAHLGKVPPVLPVIRAELGLDLVFGGWVVSIFAATAMTLGVFAGNVVDGLGYRRVILAGLAAVTLGSAAGGFATNGAALLASRCLEGLGFLAVMVAGPILIARSTFGAERRLALGIWAGNVPAGVAAMMLVSPLIANWAGWRTLWFVVAAASLGCLAFTAAATSRDTQASVAAPESGSFAHNLRLTLTRPGPWLLTVAFGLNTVMWVGLIVWLPSFLIEERGLGAGAAAALSALVVAVSVGGNVLAGWLLQRGWARWVIIAINGAAMGLAA